MTGRALLITIAALSLMTARAHAADSDEFSTDEAPAAAAPANAAPADAKATAKTADESKKAKGTKASGKEVSLSRAGQPLKWPAKLTWERFKTARGRNLRGPIVTIDAPASAQVNFAGATLSSGALLSSTATSARVRMGGLHDTMELQDSQPSIDIDLRLPATKIDFGTCVKAGIKIEAVTKPAKTPYYLMFSCVRRQGRVFVAFSHPADLTTFSSNAVENEGKGEGFKIYELNAATSLGKNGELMRFEFVIAGESQKFRVIDSLREGKNEDLKEPLFIYRASLGVGQYTISAPGRSQSSVQPLVSAEFRTAPFWGRFALSGGAMVSPGIAMSGDPETFLSVEGGLGYRVGGQPKGHAFYVEPSLRYYAIHQDFSKLAVTANHNQMGFGLWFGNKGALDSSGYEFALEASGYGTTTVGNHWEAAFRYAFALGSLPSGAGLSYAQQFQKGDVGDYNFQRLLLQLYFWP